MEMNIKIEAQVIAQSDLINIGIGLGRGLHEDDGVPHLLCEALPLRLADDSLVLQVVLVAEDHEGREETQVVRIPQSPQTFYSLLHILQAGPGGENFEKYWRPGRDLTYLSVME